MESEMSRKNVFGGAKSTAGRWYWPLHSDEPLDNKAANHSLRQGLERLIRDAIIDARIDSSQPTAEVFTVQEAADFLRVSKSSVERRIRDNEIPSFKIGRSRRILRRDLLSRVLTLSDH